MIVKKKTFIIGIILLIVILISSVLITSAWAGKDVKTYKSAMQDFENKDFGNSYYLFSKVSRFSVLKPAAIYRQALCSEKLNDDKTRAKKYSELARKYPDTILGVMAKYYKAQFNYENKKFGKAQRQFIKIQKEYPKTDYAVGAHYYLGSIDMLKIEQVKKQSQKDELKNNSVKYFKEYLREAPTGRFALNSAEKLLKLDSKLHNEDYLLIARAYLANGDFKNAQKYLAYTNISLSWPYFVKAAYGMKDYSKVKYYTEVGLKGINNNGVSINENIDDETQRQNIYEAIDIYLKTSNSPVSAISYLLSISKNSNGSDYLLYKKCNNLPQSLSTACYNTLYYKYPNGQFAADALSNIFYSKIKAKDYFTAKKLGKKHLAEFSDAKSAPMVNFWMAKVYEKTKNYDEARNYYKHLITAYPDDYYAYRAFLNLNKFRHPKYIGLKVKPIIFPYRNSDFNLITKLSEVKDYSIIDLIVSDDGFLRSWLEYKRGNLASSTRVARDAMEKISPRPPKADVRWRMVYPLNYYNEIKKDALNLNIDPVLILALIREESYFNSSARSYVGASGLMQLMPQTAREVAQLNGMKLSNDSDLFNPEINIKLGNLYYSRLKRALGKDTWAILAYNGGIGSVSTWKSILQFEDEDDFIEQIPYQETQNYLKKVYRSYWNYLRIYDGIKF